MAALNKSTMIAFSEDEGEKTMADWFRSYLARQPEQIMFGAYDLGEDPEQPSTTQFAAPDGHDVDRAALELHAKATHIMREKGVRFEDALEFVHGD